MALALLGVGALGSDDACVMALLGAGFRGRDIGHYLDAARELARDAEALRMTTCSTTTWRSAGRDGAGNQRPHGVPARARLLPASAIRKSPLHLRGAQHLARKLRGEEIDRLYRAQFNPPPQRKLRHG